MGDLKKLFIKNHTELCEEYNETLSRFLRGDAYLEAPGRTKEEIEKWRPIVLDYTIKLNKIMELYEKETGIELDHKGEFEGFETQQGDML